MATITIENVPETYIKRIGKKVKFEEIKISKRRIIEKDSTIRLQKIVNAPDNTSYGPFDLDEAIDFLDRDLGK